MRLATILTALIVFAAGELTSVHAGGHCRRGCGGGCSDCYSAAGACADAAPCQSYEMVEKTIMVPTWVNETRTVNVCRYRQETRQRTYTIVRRVPETKTVTENYTVMVPEQ